MTAWQRFRRDRVAVVALGFLLLLGVVALLAPLVAPYGISERVSDFRAGPSWEHPFGTDGIGRDVFSRVVFGARVSLVVGVLAAALAMTVGVVVGAAAAWFGGVIDAVAMRLLDVFLSIPYIVLAIVATVALGRGLPTLVLVLGLVGWPPIARLVRSSFLQVREREHVEAATAMGLSRWRVATRHVLPGALQPVVAYGALTVGGSILGEAALSFLGAGPRDPTPAWGLMVNAAQGELSTAPHLLLFPALAIFLTVLALVFVGDGLRDAFDPEST